MYVSFVFSLGEKKKRNMFWNTRFDIYIVCLCSVWYVFYEQYLTIVKDTVENLCICIGAIFIVTFLLLGFDFFSALMILITIGMVVIDILGFMYFWNITLNAVSLVNLVMVGFKTSLWVLCL